VTVMNNPKTQSGVILIVFLIAIHGLIIFSLFHSRLVLFGVTFLPAFISLAWLYVSIKKSKDTKYGKQRPRNLFLSFPILLISPILTIILNLYYHEEIIFQIYALMINLELVLSAMVIFLFGPLILIYTSNKEINGNKISRIISSISIIIPAYNEEQNLKKLLESLISTGARSKEIIVVDDGSLDNTYGVAKSYSKYFPPGSYRVMRIDHGGKSRATNYGILFARGEVVAVVDADSVIDKTAIDEIFCLFRDPSVIGVAGNVTIGNLQNFVTKCQALEYYVSINVLRKAYGVLGIALIVPGPLGAFDKKSLLQRGNYDMDTATEDFDVTLKMLRGGGRIPEMQSKAYTEAPDSFSKLYKQRCRWNEGAFQTLSKHKYAMRSKAYGIFGAFLLPIKFFSFFLIPVLDMTVIVLTIMALVYQDWYFAASCFGLYVYLYSILSVFAFFTTSDRNLKLIAYIPFMALIYRQFIDIIILKSILKVSICQLLSRKSSQNR
jgi:cellulose synthase/poly-beta-1,6-N-acetylglucosamine synthase-like glycosyltransferase